jgi:hypothetical protein
MCIDVASDGKWSSRRPARGRQLPTSYAGNHDARKEHQCDDATSYVNDMNRDRLALHGRYLMYFRGMKRTTSKRVNKSERFALRVPFAGTVLLLPLRP